MLETKHVYGGRKKIVNGGRVRIKEENEKEKGFKRNPISRATDRIHW